MKNDIIKPILEQCWEQKLTGLWLDYDKFAKLIILECGNVISNHDNDFEAHYSPKQVLINYFGITDETI